MTKPKRKIAAKKPDVLFDRIVSILDEARGNVVRAVNTQMVLAYWLIGREIVLELQGGEKRAEYGKKVVEDLSIRLTERYGRGFSKENLQFFRRFYSAYHDRITISCPLGTKSGITQIPSQVGRELALPAKSSPAGSQSAQGFSPQLTWSHYRALMRVESIEARDFCEREAVAGGWDKRTLERQIQSYYYERILKSRKPHSAASTARCIQRPEGASYVSPGQRLSDKTITLTNDEIPFLAPLAPVIRGEGSGVRGSQPEVNNRFLRGFVPLIPSPSPPRSRGRREPNRATGFRSKVFRLTLRFISLGNALGTERPIFIQP
jgi:DUF1016 N-terminal domain